MEEWIKWTIGTILAILTLVITYRQHRQEKKSQSRESQLKQPRGYEGMSHSSLSQSIGMNEIPNPLISNIGARDTETLRYLYRELLDLEIAQEVLLVQATWYGYRVSHIKNLIRFVYESEKLSNRVSHSEARDKHESFLESLQKFQSECAKVVAVYHNEDWYSCIGKMADISNVEKERWISRTEKIDELGHVAYQKLTEVLDFLRSTTLCKER